jgi:hypothetical protein
VTTLLEHVRGTVLPGAFAFLPPAMDSLPARAMLFAIGFQESGFLYRCQVAEDGRRGPARGFWQFEVGGGIAGVLVHPKTRVLIASVLRELRLAPAASACHAAVEHNDVLAAVFARLNLWWVPAALPGRHDVDEAWRQYEFAWQPGKPHRAAWTINYERGWLEATK